MSRPHPALIALAQGVPLPEIQDYPELLRSAQEHQMTGLLWSQVKLGEINGPADWTRSLAQIHLVTRRHHRKLWTALEDVTNRLSRKGIRTATFKGVTSETRWYDRAGERPCIDLDLWVAPGDLNRFGEIVRILQPDHPLGDGIQDLVDRGYLKGVTIGLESGVWVDLHADLLKLGLRSRTAYTIWTRTEPFPLPGGSTTRVLDAETSLIHFLVHLNVDRFSRLNRVTDVVRLIERAELDWNRVEDLVGNEGLEIPVYQSLRAVLEQFDIDAPVQPPSGLRSWMWMRLWPEKSRLRGNDGDRWRLRQRWLPFMYQGRLVEATTESIRRVFPPAEVLSYVFPDAKGPYFWKVVAARVRYQADWRRIWMSRTENTNSGN